MKTRYIFVTVGLLALASGFVIASNQRQAVDLAEAATAKDVAGQDVTADIAVIKDFAADHMGVRVDVFRKGSYDRAVQAAQTAASPAPQGDIYSRAQAACAGRTSSVAQSKCTSDYINANSTPAANPKAVNVPQSAAFTDSFRGPLWSLDAAGIILLASAIMALTGVYIQFLRHK